MYKSRRKEILGSLQEIAAERFYKCNPVSGGTFILNGLSDDKLGQVRNLVDQFTDYEIDCLQSFLNSFTKEQN